MKLIQQHDYRIVSLWWRESTQYSIAFASVISICTSAQQALVVVICGYKRPVGTDVRATNALRQHAEKDWSGIKGKKKQEVLLDLMSAAPHLKNCMLFFLSSLNPDLCYCHPIITLFYGSDSSPTQKVIQYWGPTGGTIKFVFDSGRRLSHSHTCILNTSTPPTPTDVFESLGLHLKAKDGLKWDHRPWH